MTYPTQGGITNSKRFLCVMRMSYIYWWDGLAGADDKYNIISSSLQLTFTPCVNIVSSGRKVENWRLTLTLNRFFIQFDLQT